VCRIVCDLGTSTVSRQRPELCCCATETNRDLGIEISLIPDINLVTIDESIASIIFSIRNKM